MVKESIALTPVQMTSKIMGELEQSGLIIRLCPGHHRIPTGLGTTLDTTIYASDERYGPHKLISVTVNRSSLVEFGSHPDNEEFLLIGDPDTKPLCLVIALHRHQVLQERITLGKLTSADFVCLRVMFNDAEVSFFTMLADIPHTEAIIDTDAKPPSFYVTEPRDLDINLMNLGNYEIGIASDI